MAGGFTIKMEKIDKFKDFLFDKYNKSIFLDNYVKDLYLDCNIYPSALNQDFYKKISVLAPFGSGNSEPKFVIENLKVINSKVLANKHIKVILLSKNGISLKAIAFNSIGSPLESYLNSSYKKFFNVAGKISSNLWKGINQIEFIIDDLAISQN